jgi:predicted dehydrogenase
MAEAPLKVGMVGCGGISHMYTDIYAGLHDLAQVVAVADLAPELAHNRAEALTAAYKAEAAIERTKMVLERDDAAQAVARVRAESAEAAAAVEIQQFGHHRELLEQVDVDAIVVLTPPSVRGEPTIDGAKAGRHVFIQGPMARSVAEADAMAEAVEAAGIHFHAQVGSRYSRGMLHAQRAIASGLMGRMALARVDLNLFRPQTYFRAGRWMGTWDGEGGTAIFHHGRYIIDPFLFVVGSPITKVTAYSGPMLRQIETDDLTLSLVEFANGARGLVQASLLHHENPLLPTYRVEIIGSEASLVLHQEYTKPGTGRTQREAPPSVRGTRDRGWETTVRFGSDHDPALVDQLEALVEDVADAPEVASEIHQSRIWLESILGGKPMPVPISVPRDHVELVRASYKSQESGESVSLPLAKDDPFYTFEGRLTKHG